MFSERDALVIATIAHFADEGLQTEDIDAKLADDELLPEVPPLPTSDEEAARREVSLVPVQQYQAALVQIRYLEDERMRLLDDVKRGRERREGLEQYIRDLEREIGVLQGRLQEIQSRRLFRRRDK